MSKKTIIIFISVFAIVGAIIFGVISLINKKNSNTTDNTTPWYQSFNPFGTGTQDTNNTGEQSTDTEGQGTTETKTSRFYQITDFAIAGATFLEDTRPIFYNETTPEPEPIKTVINADTKEGRKEIQIFLNKALSLTPPLVVDGSFGKLAIQAIKDFQELNGLTITGKIDTETAPFFTKTTTAVVEKNQYEQAPSVRYTGRMNGHIYKMFLDTKIEEKISNSTIPGIYEAFFNNIANTVIYRYLSSDNSISSFTATLGEPKGEFLPKDISDLITSPDKIKFFYLTENSNGISGVVKNFGDTKMSVVFSSPLTEWLSQWANNKDIYLTTKASYGVDGSVFLLNMTNKTISKIFGGVKGLTTLVNPNSSLVLYSVATGTGPRLGIFDITKHTTKDLGIYGLPEKCIWSSDNITIYCALPNVITGNQYPDYWYQGLISFDDYFIKMDTTSSGTTTIANSTNETPIDGTHLFLSDKEDTLFFTNKKDSTLWSLNLR
ncbi:MAG: peptidoglycan-binding domain-containing protein [Candidatus Paceibacterota bacterium]